MFSFAGGFDRALWDNFPFYCYQKQKSLIDGNERIGNICFLVTVTKEIIATEDLIRKAFIFAKENTAKNETLCMIGLGCGAGGFSEENFVKLLKEIF